MVARIVGPFCQRLLKSGQSGLAFSTMSTSGCTKSRDWEASELSLLRLFLDIREDVARLERVG
jgi:hypothetical protein